MTDHNAIHGMQFGWLLPTGKQRMPLNGIDYGDHVQQILNLIDGRFHSAWMPDHLMDGQYEIPESLSTLSYLSGQFPKLYLGTLVLANSFRNPALLAKMMATLQRLSNDRFIMGIGAGWKADEYLAYGYDFPTAAKRIAQMAEAVQICKILWDPQIELATFHGQHYQIDNAACQPKPQIAPPVMIGGGGEKLTLRVVAEHADWWNLPGASIEKYAHKLRVLQNHCREIGRDPRTIGKTWAGVVSIARSKEAAQKKMEAFNIWPGDVPLLGTPGDVQQQIKQYTDLGVSLFILSFVDEPELDGLQLFLDEVWTE